MATQNSLRTSYEISLETSRRVQRELESHDKVFPFICDDKLKIKIWQDVKKVLDDKLVECQKEVAYYLSQLQLGATSA